MLRRLYVRNYVLIDSLEIDFPEGLVIITGQTGAGKSILLGSISLVLGATADASIIGESADNCVVEAEFDADTEDSELKQLLEENDVDWDGGHLILRRVVGRSSRSRCFVNDSPVGSRFLLYLSSRLIDIHSQHQTLLLSDRSFQLSVLDLYAGNKALLDECSELYGKYQSLKAEIDQTQKKIADASREREYNEARYRQLDDARLQSGELEDLEAEQLQLANAEEIKDNLYAVENLFGGDDSDGSVPVETALREAEKKLERVSGFVPSVGNLLERVVSCRVELNDVISEISELNSKTELSRDRLEAVEERISLLYGLLNKFSSRSIDELITEKDRLGGILYDSDALASKLDDLNSEMARCTDCLGEVALQLHKSRASKAVEFASAIQKSIRGLELQDAVFEVQLQQAPLSASGGDAVLFKFSSTGKNPVDVAKCASGGELSRIMLCLKDMMARYKKMPTLIFDEIDTGVSGSVADKMGSMICAMGKNMQVFAITHLPQVAAKGSAHYLVSKVQTGGSVVTTIKKLSEDQRVLELARMLSGSTVTDTAIANAKTLLSE